LAVVKQTNLKFLSNLSSQPQKFPPNLARRKNSQAGRNLEIEYIAALRAADQIRRQADKQQCKEPEELGVSVHSTRTKYNTPRLFPFIGGLNVDNQPIGNEGVRLVLFVWK
jgi:hypothetical protein